MELSPEEKAELDNLDPYAPEEGLGDTALDIVQGIRRGYMKIPGQTAKNINDLVDWSADNLVGEGDYRIKQLDNFSNYWTEKLNEYVPKEDTTAYKTSEAMSNALVTFLLMRKVVPIKNWFARSAVAEGGASLVRDPYEERLADILADVGPDISEPIFDALRSKPGDSVPYAMLKRAGEDMALGGIADLLGIGIKGIVGIKNAKSAKEASKIEADMDASLKQTAKDIDDLEKLELEETKIKESLVDPDAPQPVPAGKPKVTPKKKPPEDKIFDSEKIAQKIIEKVRTGDLDEERIFNNDVDTDLPWFNEGRYAIQNSDDFNKIIITVANGFRKAKQKLSPDKLPHDVYEEEAETYLKELGMGEFAARLRESAKSAQELGGVLYAGKVAVNWYAKELLDTATLIRTTKNADEKIKAQARLYELETMLPNMGRITEYTKIVQESAARTTASGILDVRLPDEPMKFMNSEDIVKQFKELGPKHLDKLAAKADEIVETSNKVGKAQVPDKDSTFRILKIAKTSTEDHRLAWFLSERFRRNILLNIPTLGVNLTMNGVETILRPVGELITNTLIPIGNKTQREHSAKMLKGQLAGLWWAQRYAGKAALKALRGNKAILDPHVLQYEGQIDRGSAEYLFAKSDTMTDFMDNNKFGGALRYAINLTGKPGEWSYRLLNATDEYYKELNYFARRYGQQVAELTDDQLMTLKHGSKDQRDLIRNEVTKKIYKDSYEDGGQAIGGTLYNKQLQNAPELAEKKLQALQYARETTFTNDDLFTEGSVGAIKAAIDSSPYLQMFFPFIRTPMNIIYKGMRLTPGNPLNANLLRRMNSDDPLVALKAKGELGVAASISGMTVGFVLSDQITGKGPSDYKQRQLWLKTHQPYSIKVGNTWVDYGRYSPYSIPIKVAADMVDQVRYAKDSSMFREGEVEHYFAAYALNMLNVIKEESFTRGLKNLTTIIEAGSDNSYNQPVKIVEDIFSGMVSVKAPGQFARLITGDYKGDYMGDKDIQLTSTEDNFASFGDKVLRNFGANTAPKYNWVTGEKELASQYNTMVLGGVLPWKTKEAQKNNVIQEMISLNHPGLSSDPSKSINDVGLSASQQSDYQRIIGTIKYRGLTLNEMLSKAIASKNYRQQLSNLGKARILMSIKNEYRKEAEKQLMRDYPLLGQKLREAKLKSVFKSKLGTELIK